MQIMNIVKDSFSFVNELLCCPLVPFMCSFDIVSLFTNIPINATIEICLDKLYKDRGRKYETRST